MKPAKSFTMAVVALAVLGVCVPRPLLAAGQPTAQPVVRDVTLWQGGTLIGQVQNAQGVGKAGVPVAIYRGKQQLAVAKTDANGYFTFTGLRGGLYQLASANGVTTYRLWAAKTAPPSAQPGAIVVADQDLVRGQLGGRLGMILTHPLVIGGAVAAAIAVPIAIAANDDDDEAPGSP